MRQAYLTKFDIIHEMLEHSNVVRFKKRAYTILFELQREHREEVISIPKHGRWYTAQFLEYVRMVLNDLANKEQIRLFEEAVGIRSAKPY